jgi:hypothetical protein
MSVLASAIMADAAVFLNDASQSRFTNTALLPYLKRAYRELQLELHLNDFDTLREVTSSPIVVTAGVTTLTLPVDLIEPTFMTERLNGSSELYQEMRRVNNLPSRLASSSLLEWEWREEAINFVDATTSRQVKLRYLKSGDAITSANSLISIIDSDLYLAPMTAALAAKYIGENYDRGKELAEEAEANVDKIVRRNVKKKQGMPVRRRAFSRYLRRL